MAKNRRSLKWPKRGEVYLTRFDLTVSAEIQKTRPALIVQNDVANRYSPITIVAAITSNPATQAGRRTFALMREKAV